MQKRFVHLLEWVFDGLGWGPRRPGVGRLGLRREDQTATPTGANAPSFTPQTKARQASAVRTKAGPVGSLESRRPTSPAIVLADSRAASTSTSGRCRVRTPS
jgi:hypothetical protein